MRTYLVAYVVLKNKFVGDVTYGTKLIHATSHYEADGIARAALSKTYPMAVLIQTTVSTEPLSKDDVL